MTPQVGRDRRNPAGCLTLSLALRDSSSTTFVASSSFLDQNSNSYGGAHAGFKTASNDFNDKYANALHGHIVSSAFGTLVNQS